MLFLFLMVILVIAVFFVAYKIGVHKTTGRVRRSYDGSLPEGSMWEFLSQHTFNSKAFGNPLINVVFIWDLDCSHIRAVEIPSPIDISDQSRITLLKVRNGNLVKESLY